MEELYENHGVILGESPLGTDYHADEGSPLGFESRRPDGIWTGDLPTEEWQKDPNKPGTDKMNCVTQSSHNCLETLMIADKKEGRMPTETWDWLKKNGYIDQNGKPNFNDRIAAILNGTTKEGNYLYAVAEAVRKYGLFPESILPSDESLSWDEYYDKSKITPEMLRLGEESKKYITVNYEWVNVLNLAKHMEQSPLQIVKSGHAIEEVTKPDPLKYFDTYKPFIKSIEAKNIISAMKYLVSYQGVKDMARVIREPNGTLRIELGVGNKAVNLGINSQSFYDKVIASGEPIIDVGSVTSKQIGVIEEGLIIDSE